MKYVISQEIHPEALDIDKFDKEYKPVVVNLKKVAEEKGYLDIEAYKSLSNKINDSYLFDEDLLLPLNDLNNIINNYIINKDIDSLIKDKLQLH